MTTHRIGTCKQCGTGDVHICKADGLCWKCYDANREAEWGEPGICDQCGDHRHNVRLCNNPFIAEVFPEDENPESYWCMECWDYRKDDV